MTSLSKNKLKAASFPCQVLRIGSWEFRSRYKLELMGKFYFGKCKIVWEFLVGGVTKKMEMKWSDITGLQKSGPTLTITLARRPDFFQEIIADPNKSGGNKATKWQATADDGQATMHNTHYIECAPGVLDKHYENLIQCDTRLALLSRQPVRLVPSVSMTDLFNLCEENPIISDEQMITGLLSEEAVGVTDQWLESMSQVLFNDNTACTMTTDEALILKKVNSLGCCIMMEDKPGEHTTNSNAIVPRIDSLDSFEEMLLNLPPVSSLPKLLYGI